MPAKPRTKGKQEILRDNQSALSFYWHVSVACSAIHTSSFLVFYGATSWWHLLAASVAVGAHYLAHRTMRAIARPIYGAGQLLDGGIDLSLSGGVGEHMKDVVLFTGMLQVAGIVSDYSWWLLLLVPVRAAYIVWPYLSPWLRSSPEGMQPEKPVKRREKRVYK